MKYYSIIKKNEMMQEITWMNVKYIIVSERNQNQKATRYVIPLIGHSSKGKAQRQNKDQWLQRAGVRGEVGEKQVKRNFLS